MLKNYKKNENRLLFRNTIVCSIGLGALRQTQPMVCCGQPYITSLSDKYSNESLISWQKIFTKQYFD